MKMVDLEISQLPAQEACRIINQIKPVSRRAGNDYPPVRDIFTLQRPA